jgi:hypothetical protein
MSSQRWDRARGPSWGFAPPAPKVPKYPLLHIIDQKVVRVVIVNSRIEELGTHFLDGRTVPCGGLQDQCEFDHQLIGSPKYGGWLSVVPVGQRRTHLLRLTAVASTVEPRLRESSRDLRGSVLDVWRLGAFERSEMQCRLRLDVTYEQPIPAPIDVRFAVLRMLGADDRPAQQREQKPGQFGRAFNAGKDGGQ